MCVYVWLCVCVWLCMCVCMHAHTRVFSLFWLDLDSLFFTYCVCVCVHTHTCAVQLVLTRSSFSVLCFVSLLGAMRSNVEKWQIKEYIMFLLLTLLKAIAFDLPVFYQQGAQGLCSLSVQCQRILPTQQLDRHPFSSCIYHGWSSAHCTFSPYLCINYTNSTYLHALKQ